MFGFDFFPPKPAVKEIPDWYINTSEYHNEEAKRKVIDGQTPHTIKKCIPVFDAMTAGYILYTQVDIQVMQIDGHPNYTWPAQSAMEFHPLIQAPLHPKQNGSPYPKWMNPYSIKTPPGYSCLFVPPIHNPNNIFTIFEGLVDTDTYNAQVNFPFVLNDVKWEGIIKAGTKMAQVIPIKRDTWKHKIGSNKDREEMLMTSNKLKVFLLNSYKRQFWSRKEYR